MDSCNPLVRFESWKKVPVKTHVRHKHKFLPRSTALMHMPTRWGQQVMTCWDKASTRTVVQAMMMASQAKRWMGGQIVVSATGRDPHPTADVVLAVSLVAPRPHMAAGFPPLRGTATATGAILWRTAALLSYMWDRGIFGSHRQWLRGRQPRRCRRMCAVCHRGRLGPKLARRTGRWILFYAQPC